MNYKTELKLLEMIEKTPLPPPISFLMTDQEKGTTEVNYQIIEYFKKLNIEVKKVEKTIRIRELCKKHHVEFHEIVFEVVTKENFNKTD